MSKSRQGKTIPSDPYESSPDGSPAAHTRGQRRLKMTDEEMADSRSSATTFVEVNELATTKEEVRSSSKTNRGLSQWLKLAASTAAAVPAAIVLASAPGSATQSSSSPFDDGTDG